VCRWTDDLRWPSLTWPVVNDRSQATDRNSDHDHDICTLRGICPAAASRVRRHGDITSLSHWLPPVSHSRELRAAAMRPHSFADFRVACLLKFPTYALVPYLFTSLLIYLATTLRIGLGSRAKGRRKFTRQPPCLWLCQIFIDFMAFFTQTNSAINLNNLNLVISNPTTPSTCSYTTLQFIVNRLFSMFHEVVWQHTHARCGGIFSIHFTANLQGNLVSKKMKIG